jgi:hypothetical protein
MALVPVMFDFFPIGNHLVFLQLLILLAPGLQRSLSGSLRVHAEQRKQAFWIGSVARGTTRRHFASAHEHFKRVTAAGTSEFV